MKKLILTISLLFALQISAQQNSERVLKKKSTYFKDLSNEQIANLKTKKMTLHLNLNKKQIADIYTINLDLAKERKLKMNHSKKEKSTLNSTKKYNKHIERLDQQIAFKKRFQQVLTLDQMEKFEKSNAVKHRKKMRRLHSKKR